MGLGPGLASITGVTLMYLDTKLNSTKLDGQSLLFKTASGLISIFAYINYPILPLLPWAIEFLGFATHSTKIAELPSSKHQSENTESLPHDNSFHNLNRDFFRDKPQHPVTLTKMSSPLMFSLQYDLPPSGNSSPTNGRSIIPPDLQDLSNRL